MSHGVSLDLPTVCRSYLSPAAVTSSTLRSWTKKRTWNISQNLSHPEPIVHQVERFVNRSAPKYLAFHTDLGYTISGSEDSSVYLWR